MHNWPSMDKGHAGIHGGVCMANADEFAMTISGRGGHAAQPHSCIDPIPCGAAIVQALQTIVGRRVSPVDSAVVSVTIFQAGSAHNVIPDDVKLAGTARSFRADTRKLLETAIREVSENVAAAHGCQIEFQWRAGYPATVNHAAEAERAAGVMATVLGEDRIDRDVEPSLGAEDFAYMLEEKPGAYIWLGSARRRRKGCFTAHGSTSMTKFCRSARPTGQSLSKANCRAEARVPHPLRPLRNPSSCGVFSPVARVPPDCLTVFHMIEQNMNKKDEQTQDKRQEVSS